MRTAFTPAQLADPDLAAAEQALRACVHCGICTATCPTYVLLGDERDGPRGRIVQMQAMLESGAAPTRETVRHVDRCLSCLGCRTACPSGVDYQQLVDTARAHIETHYHRPLSERLLRRFIATVSTRPALMRAGIALAKAFAPIARRMPGRIGVLAEVALKAHSETGNAEPVQTSPGAPRVALMPGCAQKALAPAIDRAIARMLARRDVAVVPLESADCCGALAHHLGRAEEARAWARRAIAAAENEETVSIGATGCAAHLKSYPDLFRGDPAWHARAEAFAARVRDVSELAVPRAATPPTRLRVAYHPPCSLQHGMRLGGQGEALIAAAGHEVLAIPEGHLCCGSAGSYSLLQPELAGRLRARKLAHAESVKPDVIASGNIGCIHHLSGRDAPPLLHWAELLDWSEGGPVPAALARMKGVG